jgi:hypothetical protein
MDATFNIRLNLLRSCLLGIIIPLLSGCATYVDSHNLTDSDSDWFSPTALYKSKTDGSLAVEGKLTPGERITYLVIPQKVLVAAHLQTKGDVSFKDISSLSPQMRQELYLQKTLGSDYEKIASIQHQGGMDVNPRRTVNIQAAGMLPFAFAFDVVTFPLQAFTLIEIKKHGFHGPE